MDRNIWFTVVGENINRPTRNTAYSLNLLPTRSNTDIRKNFFSNRVVNTWNSLPVDVKESKSLKIFKSRIEEINL